MSSREQVWIVPAPGAFERITDLAEGDDVVAEIAASSLPATTKATVLNILMRETGGTSAEIEAVKDRLRAQGHRFRDDPPHQPEKPAGRSKPAGKPGRASDEEEVARLAAMGAALRGSTAVVRPPRL